MESELFGHTKGSFTGANQDKIGLFQAASGGTLFLDEVADLPLAMQVKLLRAIQEKTVRPVGSSDEQNTDIRLLSATHKDLAKEVEAGRFRQDLYYRINVIDVSVPSLRERLEDVPALTKNILARINTEHGTGETSLDDSAIDALNNYSFPGNVRELENILERALALSDGDSISANDLQLSNIAKNSLAAAPEAMVQQVEKAQRQHEANGDLEGYLEAIEREMIGQALEQCRWNKTATAKMLGISFRSLRYRQKKLGLDN
jgi:two-component system response regulator PilR (NtrC family)